MKRLWKIWADVDTWLGRDGFLTRDRLTGQPIQRNKIAYPETFPDVTISLEYGRKAPLDQVRKDCVLAVVWKHHLAIVLVNEDVVLVNDSSGWWNEIYWKLEAKERIWGRFALSRRCVLYLWPDLLNWSFFPSSLYWNERARDLFSGKWISIRVNALHAAPDWHLIIEIIANRDFHYPLVVDSPSLETKPNLVGDASLCRGIRDAGEYMRSFQPTNF